MEKLKSRKFWITVAAVLASLGTTVSGMQEQRHMWTQRQ